MSVRRSSILTTASLALAALAGCTTSHPTTAPIVPNGAARPVTSASAAPTARTAAMGVDGVTVAGLVLSTGTPARFGGEYCCVNGEDKAVVFSVTIRNTTTEPYATAGMSIQAHFGPNGVSGEAVYGEGVNGTTNGDIVTAGSTFTFRVGYQAPPADLGTVQVIITPTYGSPMAVFSGSVA